MKSILAILLSFLSLGVFAQSSANKPPASTCFQEWYSLFKERGANPVPTGIQDVVIAIRKENFSECYMGRVEVTEGRITGKIQVLNMDGTYSELDKRVNPSYYDSQGNLKSEAIREIHDGMSAEVTDSDGENVRLFFYKFVADKPKAHKKAPAPSALIKN